MDHDAYFKQLLAFRNDMLLLFPGGEEGFKARVAAVREASAQPLDLDADARAYHEDPATARHADLLGTVRDLSDHVREVSEGLSALQVSKDEAEVLSGRLGSMLEWFEARREALEGLVAGGQAAAHAINGAEGTDTAAGTGQGSQGGSGEAGSGS